VVEAKIVSLCLPGDAEVRHLLRHALRDSEAAAQKFGWHLSSVCELPADDEDVGYTDEDGTIFIKIRDPSAVKGVRHTAFYAYSFLLATLLHELVHLSHLGHGKAFYRCLSAALSACTAETSVRREARTHVCAELLNAVCDNDARRARALLAVMPEAAVCRRPGAEKSQLPLEYAAHHGRVALTKLLLEARADPAVCSGPPAGGDGMAPLVRAAANGNAKTAALLLAARADVVEVPGPRGQSVLDKAIAAAEANGFAGKGGEWWKIPKVLGDDRCEQASALASDVEVPHRGRNKGARSGSRRRRRRSTCSEGGSGAPPPPSGPPPAPSVPPRRIMSMPSLPTVPSLPVLPYSDKARRHMAISCLAGSLAI
jgi:hypothetical protein